MSRPWLKDDVIIVRSKSRSLSPKSKKPRVDKFGRTLPSRSRSRSRSRSMERKYRSESHDSKRSGNRGSSREFNRRRKRSSSSSSDSSNASTHSRLVASKKPKYLNARLFVANIVSKEIHKDELMKHFEKYGNVVDILVHPKNYAFIQYLKEDHARLAVEGEHGSTLKGWRLDVKMANENRGGGGRGGRGGKGGVGGRGGGSGWGGDRDRDSHSMDPYDSYGPGPRGAPGPRGPYPPPGDFGMRDPFFPDPYRRFPPDPWLPPHDDPFRRDPYADPFRDPFRGPAPGPGAAPPVIECEIFLVSAKLRAYGEAIQLRVKDHNIIVAISIMPEGRTAMQMTEELTTRKGLFAIFINQQNEQHRSLTLNILHGTPQEHRNMPLDDAMNLVGRSFQQYVEGLKEKAAASSKPPIAAATAIPSRVFLPPSSEVAYLLNLLADNRALTVAELDSIIKYLQERRDKLIDAETRPLITDDGYSRSPANFVKESSLQKDKEANIQKELTNKILSIFNGAGGNIQGVPPASSTAAAPPPPPGPVSAPSVETSGANLINFDNPNVQKALDNLIQSSPNLLKNIESKTSTASSHMEGSTTSSTAATKNGTSGGMQGPLGNSSGMQGSLGTSGGMQGPPGPPPGPPGPPDQTNFSNYQSHGGGYPPQNQGYPPQDGQNQGYPPQDGQNQGYPPQDGQNQGYPPQGAQNQGNYYGDFQGGYGQNYGGYDMHGSGDPNMQGSGQNMHGYPMHHGGQQY